MQITSGAMVQAFPEGARKPHAAACKCGKRCARILAGAMTPAASRCYSPDQHALNTLACVLLPVQELGRCDVHAC